jgi:hypothetical protein
MTKACDIVNILGVPTYRLKKEQLLPPSDNVIYEHRDTMYYLTLKNVALDDDGPYSVKASNVAGETTATARLQVKGINHWFQGKSFSAQTCKCFDDELYTRRKVERGTCMKSRDRVRLLKSSQFVNFFKPTVRWSLQMNLYTNYGVED